MEYMSDSDTKTSVHIQSMLSTKYQICISRIQYCLVIQTYLPTWPREYAYARAPPVHSLVLWAGDKTGKA